MSKETSKSARETSFTDMTGFFALKTVKPNMRKRRPRRRRIARQMKQQFLALVFLEDRGAIPGDLLSCFDSTSILFWGENPIRERV